MLNRLRNIVPPADRPSQDSSDDHRPIWREPALLILIAIVACLYVWRLPDAPIHGEESRWARGAVLMIESGDYVVPRQQNQVFPERPPLNSWTMALLGSIRGQIDVWSIRIPSVLGVLLCCAAIYVYARSFLSTAGAFAAGMIYATMGQVMQIGRLGESESLLALFVTSSLLFWHLGYTRGWKPAWTWSLAYSLAAMAALTKGLQGPVYLAAITGVYLTWRGDWRWLFCRGHVIGLLAGATWVAVWQVPFLLATDIQSVRDIWTGLVMDRITWSGLILHMTQYPFETLACLLPWSLMLVQLIHKEVRRSLSEYRYHLQFVVLAILITYPSVWLVTGARGRYYMPLYGCLAVIFAIIVQVSLTGAPGSWAARGWHRFARIVSIGCAVAGGVVLTATLVPMDAIGVLRIPIGLALVVCLASGVGVWLVFRSAGLGMPAVKTAVPVIALLGINLGLAYAVIAVQLKLRNGHHVRDNVARIKSDLPTKQSLVSFGPIHHRFAYHFGNTVEERTWPDSIDDIENSLEYFCIDRHVWDTPERRLSGRGRSWTTTSGSLPFAWEVVAEIPMDPEYMDSECWVLVGRILRDSSTGRVLAAEPGASIIR